MARSTMATVVLNAEDRASQHIRALGRQVTKLTAQVDKMGKKSAQSTQKQASGFEKLYESARKYFYIFETGRRIVQVFTAAIIDPLKQAAQQAMDFGKALAEVSTLYGKDVVDPSGNERMAKLVNSVKDFSYQFAKMPVDQAKALYFAISAGALKATDATELLRVTNMLATAGMVDAETATRSLTTVINAFVPQLENVEDKFKTAERVSDLYFITVQKGVTTIGELAPKIGRVASSAATANMSMETMFALIAAGTKAIGRTPYTITGMAAAIKNVLSPTEKSRKEFKRLGLDFGITATQGDEFAKLMQTIGERFMKPAGDAARITAAELDKLFPRARASRFVMAVIGKGAMDLMNTLRVMQNQEASAGATREAYAKITATAAFQQERLMVATNLLGIEIGEVGTKGGMVQSIFKGLSTVLMQTAVGLRETSKNAKDSNKNMEDMVRIVTGLGIILLGVVAVIAGAFATLFNSMALGFKAVGLLINAFVVETDRMLMILKSKIQKRTKELASEFIAFSESISGNTFVEALDDQGNVIKRVWSEPLNVASQAVQDFVDMTTKGADSPELLAAKVAAADAELVQIANDANEAVKSFAEFEASGFGLIGMGEKFTSVVKNIIGDIRNFEGSLDDMTMDQYIQKLRDMMDTTQGTGDAFELAAGKIDGYANALAGLAGSNTPIETGQFKKMPEIIGPDPLGISGLLIGPEISVPNIESALKTIKPFISGLKEVSGPLPGLLKLGKVMGDTLPEALVRAGDVLGGFGGVAISTLTASGMKTEDIIKLISDVSKMTAKDLKKLEESAVEATKASLHKRTEAALAYNDGIRDNAHKLSEQRYAIAKAQSDAQDQLDDEAKQKADQRMQEIESLASSIASTVVGLGTTLIKDLIDKEKTAEEAFKSLGNSLLEMGATAVAEFLVGEGVKQVMIAVTSGLQATAAAAEITASNTTRDVVLANESAKQAAKLGTAASGAGGAVGDAVGGAAGGGGLGLWGILIMAVIGVIGALLSWLMDDDSKYREATKLEAAYMKEARYYSRGGLVTGGVAGRDSVSAMLTPGEYVLNKATVDSIRQGTPPSTPGRYASGGMVTAGGGTQVVFAPRIETIGLPNSIQNMRYFRDTVAKTRGRLAGLRG